MSDRLGTSLDRDPSHDYCWFLGLVGEANRAAGKPREALAVIDQALRQRFG
jgi:hypothetical protein